MCEDNALCALMKLKCFMAILLRSAPKPLSSISGGVLLCAENGQMTSLIFIMTLGEVSKMVA